MLWGQCASCPNILPAQQEQHGCCAHHHSGKCGVPSPKQPVERSCPSLALVPESTHAVTLDLAVLVAPVPASPAPADRVITLAFPVSTGELLAHAPPDLYLLNATLLI